MKLDKALEMEKVDFEKRLTIRKMKGDDYAKDEDCLTNFKVIAEVQKALEMYGYGIPIERPVGTALWHLLHKLIRLVNLINKGIDPRNESLEDTFLDMNNYVDLAKECYIDELERDHGDQ